MRRNIRVRIFVLPNGINPAGKKLKNMKNRRDIETTHQSIGTATTNEVNRIRKYGYDINVIAVRGFKYDVYTGEKMTEEECYKLYDYINYGVDLPRKK